MHKVWLFAALILVMGCAQPPGTVKISFDPEQVSGVQLKTFTVDLEFYAFEKQGQVKDVEQATNTWLAAHPDLRIISITPTGGKRFVLTVKYETKRAGDAPHARQVKIFEKDLEFYAFEKQWKAEDVEQEANAWLAAHRDLHIVTITPAAADKRHSITVEYKQ